MYVLLMGSDYATEKKKTNVSRAEPQRRGEGGVVGTAGEGERFMRRAALHAVVGAVKERRVSAFEWRRRQRRARTHSILR